MYDGGAEPGLPRDLHQFCCAGEPPVAFTFGTGLMHAGNLFASATKACENLGKRAIFLTRYPQQLSRLLPSSIHASAFAPFQELFPLCAAVVHHGGIGTVAKAFHAAKPQLVLPVAFDQKDNATRVERLGVGTWLGKGKRSARHITEALAGILNDKTLARCEQLRVKFRTTEGLGCAADLVEQLERARIQLQPEG